ncbi:succinylglutamate desuccinylase/aspartoacylase family protein [Halogeometricum luteum]|uniref:Succinylglutamate desuccinylase/aspartoacylase family protein n=1 Tax=Halogeometricum luteum TaxID=2950537 RepID=A0ABU2G106_9EURY|nr:succinylglutamate desuccinylase/aspartoacylase family protein [Halogeometricum sp. S3BR5-2]MDS0294465.1 succinylglutamate desuccinylase/aspartoacylase family protein [Halogeometricum sp. S3BR5-2]
MHVGSVESEPGAVVSGWFEATDLPTGGTERLPLVVAEGESAGPTLWLTGGVHGDEATGVAVAQDAMRADLAANLSGTVACVPVVNPAGLRRNARQSYYGDDDPNRYFPDPDSPSSRPPGVQERIDERLYEAFAASADALLDLHTAQIGSMPFLIRDRVLYGERRSESEAEELSAELDRLADAYGFPTLTEYPAAEYVEQALQRSTAGAALNAAGIPAVTVELGGHSVVEEEVRAAGVAGVYGVLVELGMLDSADVPEDVGDPGVGVPDAPVDYPVRRAVHPRTETAGLVRHRVEPGDAVESGDTVADVVTPQGERVDTVETGHDGYVVARREGLVAYEGDPVLSMAVRDDGDAVVPRDANAESE